MAKRYEARPAMALEAGKSYTAEIELEKGGVMVADLFAADAPETVNSFVFLAQEGFYDGLTFHRVIPGFVAQGGDPAGTGTGGPGYTVPAEFNANKHLEGTLAMARSQDPDSAGSQFYLCLDAVPHLDGQYTVFGQVREGLEVMHTIRERAPESDREPGDAIKTIRIRTS